MTIWIVLCPNCGTENQITPEMVVISCGVVTCDCICDNCETVFKSSQDYARWLGVKGPLPSDVEAAG